MECLNCHSHFESRFILAVHQKKSWCARSSSIDERERYRRSLHDRAVAEQLRYEIWLRLERERKTKDLLVASLILDDIICCKDCFEKKIR